jgi:CheY-like chemotaxis protein
MTRALANRFHWWLDHMMPEMNGFMLTEHASAV